MEKILYLECYSGISGDMTVGALLDLGADKAALEKALGSMKLEGCHLHFGRTKKCGIDAFDFDVHLEHEEHHHHDSAEHKHSNEHNHDHNHDHVHNHDHHDYNHEHHHRGIDDIYALIDGIAIDDNVKLMAKRMFDIIAEAEAKAHGIPKEEVHFHEVGAVDSIVDIVGTAVCLDSLNVSKVIVSSLYEGRGYVKCQHGVMPVPVPATLNIVQNSGLELKLTENEGEMVTPTGAAIAAALHCGERLPEHYKIIRTGIGAGTKDFKQANILRAMLIEAAAPKVVAGENKEEQNEGENGEQLWQLETNLDDCTGEALGLVLELLLEEGANDVWYTPIYMKKNRPAYMLSVLCEHSIMDKLQDIIFLHTTTVGIRRRKIDRVVLQREVKRISTPLGEADVKLCYHGDRIYCYPEYESVKKICAERGMDFQTVYRSIVEFNGK